MPLSCRACVLGVLVWACFAYRFSFLCDSICATILMTISHHGLTFDVLARLLTSPSRCSVSSQQPVRRCTGRTVLVLVTRVAAPRGTAGAAGADKGRDRQPRDRVVDPGDRDSRKRVCSRSGASSQQHYSGGIIASPSFGFSTSTEIVDARRSVCCARSQRTFRPPGEQQSKRAAIIIVFPSPPPPYQHAATFEASEQSKTLRVRPNPHHARSAVTSPFHFCP